MNDKAFDDGLKIINYFAWMRWISIVFITYVVLHLKYVSQFDFPLTYCLMAIVAGSLYNYVTPYAARWFKRSNWSLFIYLMGSLDILFATILIHYTGGVSSPLIYLYFLLVIAGAIFGFSLLDYALSCQIAAFFGASCVLEAFGYIGHYPVGSFFGYSHNDFRFLSAAISSLFLACLLITYVASYLANQILENQKKIEALSNARVDFINQVVHEIKGPLTSIIGYAELFNRDKLGALGEAQKEPMGVIERQSHRVLDMVNDLLSLARLESGMVKFDKKPASLIDVAVRVIEEVSPLANSQRVEIIQEFDHATPRVDIDEDKIHEVFMNLLTNSLKFCPADGCRIVMTIGPSGKEVVAAVRDEGIGIDPGDLPHIFERFYRASKESAARKGTGLGLAISRSIVEAHGGRMWAASGGLGKGAVFYFALPIPA